MAMASNLTYVSSINQLRSSTTAADVALILLNGEPMRRISLYANASQLGTDLKPVSIQHQPSRSELEALFHSHVTSSARDMKSDDSRKVYLNFSPLHGKGENVLGKISAETGLSSAFLATQAPRESQTQTLFSFPSQRSMLSEDLNADNYLCRLCPSGIVCGRADQRGLIISGTCVESCTSSYCDPINEHGIFHPQVCQMCDPTCKV